MLCPESDSLLDLGRTAEETARARAAASQEVRSALGVHYVVPVDSADIADDEARAIIESQALAIALKKLAVLGAVTTAAIDYGEEQARAWLVRVKSGEEAIALPAKTGTAAGFQPLVQPRGNDLATLRRLSRSRGADPWTGH